MRDYNTELNALQGKLARKGKIESMLRSLRSQLTELQSQEQRLCVQREKEQADVDRLEKGSLVTFFYAVISKKEEKLDREKAEAYAAAVKHDTARRQVEAVEYDIHTLETELRDLSEVQMNYDRLFAEKLDALKLENPAFDDELCRIEDRLGYIAAQKQEVDEALSVGQGVLRQITSIESSLDSAEGWGTWDLWGGGLISDLAKHSHLDDAQTQINDLQDSLRRYHTELTDVTVQANVQAQVDDFLRFADYFFDGLFADWAVLDSIHSSQQQIRSTRSQVEATQGKLVEMKSAMQAEEATLNKRIRELVLGA
ncbi:hypothetical protein [Oscillibacter sp.]|uniref:hypothetical protein n=1 Tax=Oscillibacter sp. TaxID=1945593 RepID=UPI0028A64E5D|nr:hypothetical protein [Oscillibacter sp.]